jgi:2-haloacid dehalogenase
MGAMLAASSASLIARSRPKIRAIAFDAFVLFDPSAVMQAARSIMGGQAEAFLTTAQMKLFAYSWFYTSAGRYKSFELLAADAFRFAASIARLDLSTSQLNSLVAAYSKLRVWPDVPAALQLLRQRGLRLALLSNLSEEALRSNLRQDGIADQLEFVLSTDKVQQFKPASEAYRLGVDAFGMRAEQIGFAASAGWDASGATWFGYPTVWVNRSGASPEPAHASAMISARGMDGVLRLAIAS